MPEHLNKEFFANQVVQTITRMVEDAVMDTAGLQTVERMEKQLEDQIHKYTQEYKKIEVKNFKKFDRYSVTCGGLNILTGPNNAGKSTILDALRIASDVLKFASYRKPAPISCNGDIVFGFETQTQWTESIELAGSEFAQNLLT
jgi:recombinational DNA repair ATPase RecF